ncbi:unnamed protein product [Rotaria sp. Silwood2]|nr:unnamed protein product [Rotaria sp. Silwood2]
MIMRKYSYGKQYEQLLQAAELIEEDILQPKQFHITRFASSECRVYETMMRDWSTLYELHEQDSIVNALTGGDLSARTRHNINSQQETDAGNNGTLQIEESKSVDFVCKLVGLIDIYNIIVKASVFVQNVDKYPWEYDNAIRRLQECLNNYATL